MNQDLCIKIDNLSNIQRKKEIEKTLQKIQNKYVGAPIKESTPTIRRIRNRNKTTKE